MKRDNRIELYRFIFACIIMVFHAHNVNNGQGHPIPLGHVVDLYLKLTRDLRGKLIHPRGQ